MSDLQQGYEPSDQIERALAFLLDYLLVALGVAVIAVFINFAFQPTFIVSLPLVDFEREKAVGLIIEEERIDESGNNFVYQEFILERTIWAQATSEYKIIRKIYRNGDKLNFVSDSEFLRSAPESMFIFPKTGTISIFILFLYFFLFEYKTYSTPGKKFIL